MVLSPRQELLLRKVVEGYAALGQPVGSKLLAAAPDVGCGPSTIRNELAVLEERGLLAHPHTSAGRVPTPDGYRHYVDHLLEAPTPPPAPGLRLELARREVDAAIRATTEALSQVTNLLAVVSAPPIESATVRHVELLVLQPQVLMLVVITSAGGVSKRIFTLDQPVDPGLADWARAYLNERLVGMGLGARLLRGRLVEPDLGPRERAFVDLLSPAFTDLAATADDGLYVDGAARLLAHGDDGTGVPNGLSELLGVLERRATVLGVLQAALSEPGVYVRIGAENQLPALHRLSMVAANYGLPQRNLGTVSVVGPLRMDYAVAIGAVREAAAQLSRFVEEVYA